MRVGRYIFHNSGDMEIQFIFKVKSFSHRVLISEILFSHLLGNNNSIFIFQNSLWISFNQRKRKKFKNIRIREIEPCFLEVSLLTAYQYFPVNMVNPHSLDDFWKFPG